MKKLLKFLGYAFLAISVLGFFLMKISDKKVNKTENNQQEQTTSESKLNDFNEDSIINAKIKALQCNEKDFMKRQEQNSGFIDLKTTSFEKRLIVWRKDYIETKFYIGKKMLQELARVYRDFECIDKITMRMYCKEDDNWYECKISRKEYENYTGVSFSQLREDIKNWRNYIESNRFSKDNVDAFHKAYVKLK